MKKLSVLIALILFLPIFAQAQGKFDHIIKKYQGKKGITTVNLTGDMFETLRETSDEEGQDIPNGIEGMLILTYEKKVAGRDYPLYSEILEVIKKEDYKTLMSVNDSEERVNIYVRKDKKEIREFLLLVSEPGEVTFIWMTGELNMKDIKKIQGMNNFEDMFENGEDDDEDDDDEHNSPKKGK